MFLRVVSVASLLVASVSSEAREIRFTGSQLPDKGHVVVAVAKDAALTPLAADIDRKTNGALALALRAAGFKGESGSSQSFYALAPFDSITVIGLGEKTPDRIALENFGGEAAKRTTTLTDHAIVVLPPTLADAETVATGAALQDFRFEDYKSKKADLSQALLIASIDATVTQKRWSKQGQALAEGVHLARNLISEPSNIKSPEWFVEQTRNQFKNLRNVKIEVLDVSAMRKLGMGAMLGVGQGSPRPPRMLIVHYTGKANEQPIVITGKGITFDTGGISIKPGAGMWKMRYDMAGAAAAVGTALAVAKQELPVNLVAIAALAENMPDGNAIRPGDVLRAMNGKTIEIMSTDAEGRLVLADASWYAQTRWQPRAQLSIATLTGAARAALGSDFAALLTRNDALAATLTQAGEVSGEPLWRLPLIDSHAKAIKSDVADIKNGVEGGNAGASLGAQFIAEFIKPETPWAHLDIAGMAWAETDSPTVPKGAVGFGVRLLEQYVQSTVIR